MSEHRYAIKIKTTCKTTCFNYFYFFFILHLIISEEESDFLNDANNFTYNEGESDDDE